MSCTKSFLLVLIAAIAMFVIIPATAMAVSEDSCADVVITTCNGEELQLELDRENATYTDNCAWSLSTGTILYWDDNDYLLFKCTDENPCSGLYNSYDNPHWELHVALTEEGDNSYATYVLEGDDLEGTYTLDETCNMACTGGYWDQQNNICYGEWYERCWGDPICGSDTMEVSYTSQTGEAEFYEIEYTSEEPVFQVMLTETSTSKYLAIFSLDTDKCTADTIDSYYSAGLPGQTFYMRIESLDNGGETIKILSRFSNQALVEVNYCDSGSEQGDASGPKPWYGNTDTDDEPPQQWVNGGGTYGDALTAPYEDCDLEFAGSVRLIVIDQNGRYARFRNEVMDPLESSDLWESAMVNRKRFTKIDDGYKAVVEVKTTYCAQKVVDALELDYEEVSVEGRSVIVVASD